MRKGRNGGEKKWGKKRLMIIVATTSLPAVERPNADRWNAALSCQNFLVIPCSAQITDVSALELSLWVCVGISIVLGQDTRDTKKSMKDTNITIELG